MTQPIDNLSYPEDLEGLNRNGLQKLKDRWKEVLFPTVVQAIKRGAKGKLTKRHKKLVFRQLHRIRKRLRVLGG